MMNEDRIIELIAAQASCSAKVDALHEDMAEVKSDIKEIKYNTTKQTEQKLSKVDKVKFMLSSAVVAGIITGVLKLFGV